MSIFSTNGREAGRSIWENRKKMTSDRMRVDFEPLNEHPNFSLAVDVMVDNYNQILAKNGASKINLSPGDIRFIDEQDWKRVEGTINHSEDTGGFYIRSTNSMFISCQRKLFDYPDNLLWNIYVVGHELGHKVTYDLEKVSFRLSEGVADFLARDTLTDNVLNTLGLSSSANIPFARPSQLKMIDILRQEISADLVDKFLRLAFQGAGYVQTMLSKKYGRYFMELIYNKKPETVGKIIDFIRANP